VQLKIKGVGKIQDSTIEMNGITAIAGENSTGKSTYGKVLYCMFNAFCNKKATIHRERIDNIRRVINSLTEYDPNTAERLSEKIIDDNENNKEFVEDNIRKIFKNTLSESSLFTPENEDAVINNVIKDIKRSLAIDDNEIQKKIASRYFRVEFEGQINHVNKPQSTGNASLVIQGKNIDVTIENNECSEYIDNVEVRHNAIYIDTPFVMDDIPYRKTLPPYRFFRSHRNNLRHILGKEYSSNTVIEEVIVSQKITDILSNIPSVIQGKFIKEERSLMFMENGLKKPIPLSSVSAGIKTFLIIKRLLELGEIKERDVLILDEPEIHLHPEWQLQFAELLILLQKEFNLTILLTTHSPYFLNALEIYGEKLGIKEKINFYLAENNDDISNIREVTGSLDIVYKQLAKPFQKLEDAAYED
jgi:predicted ATPase